jgi:hypothetical protein
VGSSYAGTIFYNCLNAAFAINTGSRDVMSILNSGCVGVGTLMPVAPLHAAGVFNGSVAAPISLSQGVLSGMDPTTTTTAKIVICAGSNSGLGIIDFGYAGQRTTGTIGNATTNCGKLRIQGSMNTAQLSFYTNLGYAMMIDGSTNGNNCLLIGGSTTQTAYKLHVTGSSFATTVAGTNKPFDLPHLSKPGHRLRHRAIESPKASVIHTYQVACEAGTTTVALPEYFSWLADSPLVFVSPFRCFGQGWGEVAGECLSLTVSAAGTYNVMIYAARADPGAVAEFEEFGVEYPDPNVSQE